MMTQAEFIRHHLYGLGLSLGFHILMQVVIFKLVEMYFFANFRSGNQRKKDTAYIMLALGVAAVVIIALPMTFIVGDIMYLLMDPITVQKEQGWD